MASTNGKLIYQLTSASALRDTDLFAISSTDNLTRNVSLGQIKAAVASDFYNKEDANDIFDELREQIKELSDDISDVENNITEFRNEFNTQLQQLNAQLTTDINNTKSTLNTTINNLDTTLSKKITDLETKLTNMVNNVFSYGTTIPTTLESGKIYLQIF